MKRASRQSSCDSLGKTHATAFLRRPYVCLRSNHHPPLDRFEVKPTHAIARVLCDLFSLFDRSVLLHISRPLPTDFRYGYGRGSPALPWSGLVRLDKDGATFQGRRRDPAGESSCACMRSQPIPRVHGEEPSFSLQQVEFLERGPQPSPMRASCNHANDRLSIVDPRPSLGSFFITEISTCILSGHSHTRDRIQACVEGCHRRPYSPDALVVDPRHLETDATACTNWS